MKLLSSFDMPMSVEKAWPLLLDVPTIAPCVPGASLTEDRGDGQYAGTVTLKLGPVQLQFAGNVAITDLDLAARTAKISAKGADRKGRGNAVAQVDFALHPSGEDATRVEIVTDLQLTGSVAQYGRAEGLVKSVANQIVSQFASNLRRRLAAGAEGSGDAAQPSDNGLSVVSLGLGMLKTSFGGRQGQAAGK